MTDPWEDAFVRNQLMWGHEPAVSARRAAELFAAEGVRSVLVPGIGYGRNALPFLAKKMQVAGIEISETAIGLSRSELGLDVPIFHGSVTAMPFDDRVYDAVFAFGLLYLLSAEERAKVLRDCFAQLAPGGSMVVTLVSKSAPMYGRGTRIGEDWFETHPGIRLYFYDASTIARDFGPFGLVSVDDVAEAGGGGATIPFHYVVCKKPLE